MTRLRVLGVILTVLIAGLLPSAALAQPIQTVKLIYWPANITGSTSAGTFTTWNTGFFGVDYRVETQARWGFHLLYVGGSQSAWTGILAGATSGNDSNWSADVSYRFPTPMATARGFLGYGSYSSGTNINPRFTASGFRIGADATFPLGTSNWSLNGSVAYSPSNSTSSTASTVSASDTATDYSVSLQYTSASKWNVEVGYRGLNVGTGVLAGFCTPAACNFQSTGFFVTVGRTFP